MGPNSQRDIALQETVTKHRARLRSVIRRLVRDQVEAEDILQDVFEELITAYDLGLAIEHLGSWLATVARNKVFDRFRRKKMRDSHEQAAREDDVSLPKDEGTQLWLREEIILAIELLPSEQRQVFVMYELEGMSFKEIAARTGVSMGTLMARKKYAVDFLREHLKEIYYDDE